MLCTADAVGMYRMRSKIFLLFVPSAELKSQMAKYNVNLSLYNSGAQIQSLRAADNPGLLSYQAQNVSSGPFF